MITEMNDPLESLPISLLLEYHPYKSVHSNMIYNISMKDSIATIYCNFIFNVSGAPASVGKRMFTSHIVRLALTTGISSTPWCSKKYIAENSLTPRSLRKLNDGNTDFASSIHVVPAMLRSIAILGLNI